MLDLYDLLGKIKQRSSLYLGKAIAVLVIWGKKCDRTLGYLGNKGVSATQFIFYALSSL